MNAYNRWRKGIPLILTAAMVMAGCGDAAEDVPQEEVSAIAVKAVTSEVGTLSISNQFVGTVSPQQQVSIIPLVSGEIDAVYAEVGDEVSAGDVLFHINDEAARLQKESAELSKKSAELSAQRTLGSAQTMSNIQMQSNIKSLEYQVKMAQDQYDAAVSGAADAREASDKMDDMISEIEDGADELQSSYAEMKKAVAMAKQCISWNGVTGWQFRSIYVWPQNPDAYDWDRDEEEAADKTPAFTIPNLDSNLGTEAGDPAADGNETEEDSSAADETEKETDAASAENPETDSAEKEENGTESTSGSGQTEPGAGALEPGSTDNASEPGSADNASEPENADSALETGSVDHAAGQDPDGGSGSGEDEIQPSEESEQEPEASRTVEDAGQEPEAAEAEEDASGDGTGVYFSQTKISLGDALEGLLGDTDLAGLTPPDVFSSKEEAWKAYEAQQGIDEAQRALAAMGYTADDLGEGRVDEDLEAYASQIASMKTQAATLKSNQASLESNIKSADQAKDSTAKAIDFYYDNLNDAVTTYQIQNGEAYQDTANALEKQIEAAEVGVKSAEMQLEYYSPTTPISGTVVSKGVELYGLAQPGYAAYVISNQDAMNVTFAVSGQVRETLQIGMPVTLEKDGKEYGGTITEIGETVDAQSGGLFKVKAITEADGDKLVSGTAVKLTVDTFRAENAILIPYDAVHFESEQAYVFAIVDHKAVRTPVTVGLMNEDMVQITEGLEAGSQVVATWSSQLEDGAEVRIIGESQTSAESSETEEAGE